jgi:hypothetical protein
LTGRNESFRSFNDNVSISTESAFTDSVSKKLLEIVYCEHRSCGVVVASRETGETEYLEILTVYYAREYGLGEDLVDS